MWLIAVGLFIGFCIGYILGSRRPPTPPTGTVGTNGGLA